LLYASVFLFPGVRHVFGSDIKADPTLTLPILGREQIRDHTRIYSATIRLLPQIGGGWEGVVVRF